MSAAADAPRVVFVNNSRESFTPTVSGAIATCLWEVVRAGAQAGVRATVITTNVDATPYDWPETVTVPLAHERGGVRGKVARARRRVDGWSHVRQRPYARRVRAELTRLAPQIVICNNDPEVAAYLADAFPQVRVLHWFHNLEYAGDRWRRRYTMGHAVRSVAVSRYLARAVEGAFRLNPGSVACVYPGVDADAFVRPSATPARDAALPVIGFVGRVCVEKGVDVLLRACLLLADRRQDFAVQIVGDTNWGFSDANPYRLQVDALAGELVARGITVDRLGHVARADVPAAIARTDLQVVPSRWDEPFGLVVVEGMALGVPVIVSAAGGMPEMIGSGGRLVPREDPEQLAVALGALLDDPALRATLGVQARAAAESFSWRRTWDALLAVGTTGGATNTAEGDATNEGGRAR